MPLDVIGAGFPRTGTLSQKLALEQLGFGPCHHMTEVFANPWQLPLLEAAGEGRLGDWEELFGGYRATTDAPGCFFWRELAERYPKAKVVLSTREPERWLESVMATVLSSSHQETMGRSPVGPVIRKLSMRMFGSVGGAAPQGPPGPPQLLAAFEAHYAAVKAAIPPDRLLVYSVSQGWAPLCRFLGVPVPDAPFPRVNSREEFHTITIPVGNGSPA